MIRGRTWIELSGAAWRSNLRAVRQCAPQAAIMPMVKANAYGHGLAQVLQVLKTAPIWGVGVAHGEEALVARQLGWRGNIAVLSSWQPGELPELVNKKIGVVVHNFTTLKQVQTIMRKGEHPIIHLKLDTGTTRIGFLPSDLPRLKTALKNIRLASIFSHLANAEDAQAKRTNLQVDQFTNMSAGLIAPLRHVACSAAIIRYPTSQYDLVRPGFMFYGYWPTPQLQSWAAKHLPHVSLQPVLSWKARLTSVKRVPAGTRVGYGSTWTTKKATTIGVVPVGYYDGLDRRLSNQASLVFHGRPVPIVGRICMNLTMVNLGSQSAAAGDIIEIAGRHQSLGELAGRSVFAYEFLTRLSSDIPRFLT